MKNVTRKADLTTLVKGLEAQKLQKRDLVVPSKFIDMQDGLLVINNLGDSALDSMLSASGISRDDNGTSIRLSCLDICDAQIAEKLGIPKAYYDKMRTDATDLLGNNVRHWMQKSDANYFLRTFAADGDNGIGYARAFLSDRFKVIDNLDVLMAALDAIHDSPFKDKVQIEYCDITDKKMYIRFVAPSIEVEAGELMKKYRVPDNAGTGRTGIMSGFILTNSETGHGKFSISPRAVVGACSNGIIFKDDQFAKLHLGSQMEEGMVQWSEETVQKNLALIVSQVKDAVKTYLSPEFLGQKIALMEAAAAHQLAHPVDAVANVCTHYSIGKEKQETLVNYFIQGGDTTGWGLSQAVTFYAHHNANADDQFELEQVGFDLLGKVKMFDVKASKN